MNPLGDDAPYQPSTTEAPASAPPPAGELTVSRASSEEWHQVVEWAAEEQWNPGLGDTACFHATDPGGFFLGRLEGRPVSAVSVVNYSDAFAFLGYYLVHPDLRGRGLGMTTWQAAVPRAGDRTIGLDAVPAQEATYRRSGFTAAYRTSRHAGRPVRADAPSAAVVPATAAHLDAVADYDRRCFPAGRRAFLGRWLSADGHTACVYPRDGDIAGYGVIRRARDGHRVGPLFADTPEVAEALFDALTAHLGPDDEAYVDVPEDHDAACSLATSRGLEPRSHTVRMYNGPAPTTQRERVFGVTSLELG